MSIEFLLAIAGIFVWNAALIAFMTWAVHSKQFSQYRIRTPSQNRIPISKKITNVFLNMLLSLLLFLSVFYYLSDQILYATVPSGVTIFGEVLASLMLYDFMYYFFHRGMHHPKMMKYVHGVHH
ncbi:MAG: sterol desaturase family protein, partial [Spongiibacteraceae bacterium]